MKRPTLSDSDIDRLMKFTKRLSPEMQKVIGAVPVMCEIMERCQIFVGARCAIGQGGSSGPELYDFITSTMKEQGYILD